MLGLWVLTGAMSSIGPCAAPRYVALSALLTSPGSSKLKVGAFVAGVLIGTAALVLSTRAVILAASASPLTYWLLAAGLVVIAFWMLASREHDCRLRPLSTGAALVLGASTTLLVSPCCTPVLLALGALAAMQASPWAALAAAFAFAVGHIASLLILVPFMRLRRRAFATFETALRTLGAGLLLALGSYYAVLA